jgi:hypothetical protein
VLPWRWEDADLGIETEIKRLGQVFSSLYRFEIHEFRNPRKSPGLATISHLSPCLLKGGLESLLIVYYAGHVCLSQQTNEPPIWTAYVFTFIVDREFTRYTEMTSTIHQPSLLVACNKLLEEAELDVLLLYDSCHSSHPAVSVKAKE